MEASQILTLPLRTNRLYNFIVNCSIFIATRLTHYCGGRSTRVVDNKHFIIITLAVFYSKKMVIRLTRKNSTFAEVYFNSFLSNVELVWLSIQLHTERAR